MFNPFTYQNPITKNWLAAVRYGEGQSLPVPGVFATKNEALDAARRLMESEQRIAAASGCPTAGWPT
jgi:hypothetical protein